MRRPYLLLAIGLLIPLTIILSAGNASGQAAPVRDKTVALEVVARLNEWRLGERLWPLKLNDTLEAVALAQAQYLAALPNLPADEAALHLGIKNDSPQQRATSQPFNWPAYGRPDRVAIGENAAVGSVDLAINFWKSSKIHRDTVLDAGYREVGVAALPYRSAYLFIAEFGARPNVLPALRDPQTGKLHLSNERYKFSDGGTWMHNASQVRFFDGNGSPLTASAVPWQDTMDMPQGVISKLYVLYTDGNDQAITEVRLGQDMVLLPGFAPVLAAALAPTPTTVKQAVIPPTNTPVRPAASVPSVPSTDPDLVVVYDDTALSVVNTTSHSLDVHDLDLAGNGITLPFSKWTLVADIKLDSLPSHNCLQIRADTETGLVQMPDNCKWVRSLLEVAPERLFWIKGSFEVHRQGVTLTTCQTESRRCEVRLKPPT